MDYHNLKLDEKSSYLITFPFQFGRYRYGRLPFGATTGGDMFQKRIDEIFKELPFFGIADDILAMGYDKDGRDHNSSAAQSTPNIQKRKPTER